MLTKILFYNRVENYLNYTIIKIKVLILTYSKFIIIKETNKLAIKLLVNNNFTYYN